MPTPLIGSRRYLLYDNFSVVFRRFYASIMYITSQSLPVISELTHFHSLHQHLLRNVDSICDICLGLFNISPSSDDKDISNDIEKHEQTVRIAHFSVHEYLESEQIYSQNAAIFSLNAVTAHVKIMQICVIYILELGFAVTKLNEYPLARYATRFWLFYYRNIGYQDSKSNNLMLELFQCKESLFLSLIKLLELVNKGDSNGYILEKKNNPSLVYYAYLLGLKLVLAELLPGQQQKESGRFIFPVTSTDKVADINAPGRRYYKALQAAVMEGHKEIVKVLIHEGVDFNTQGGEYGNVLQAAYLCGSMEIVKMLLHDGTDLNAQGRAFGNALQAASFYSHEEILKLLLHEGADVGAQGGGWGSALNTAFVSGHKEVLKLLLQ